MSKNCAPRRLGNSAQSDASANALRGAFGGAVRGVARRARPPVPEPICLFDGPTAAGCPLEALPAAAVAAVAEASADGRLFKRVRNSSTLCGRFEGSTATQSMSNSAQALDMPLEIIVARSAAL